MSLYHHAVVIENMVIFIFGFFAVIFVLIFHTLKIKKYKKSSYYKITKNSYFSVRSDKGRNGEYLIYERLKYLESLGGKFLFNLYIPRSNNQKTEIDIILVHSKGLFVFESKNFGGWIFGNEMHQNWMQAFPVGRGRSRKNSFYNPVKQNEGHIRHLKNIVGKNIPIHSIIIFSDRCTLKDVTVFSKDVIVTYSRCVSSAVDKICNEIPNSPLTKTEVDWIYGRLLPYTQNDDEVVRQHIRNLHKY